MLQRTLSPGSGERWRRTGFDRYAEQLAGLGSHSTSVSCLYATRLDGIDLDILTRMLEESYALSLRDDPGGDGDD